MGLLITGVIDGAAVVAPWSWLQPVEGPVPHAVVRDGVADTAWDGASIPAGHLLVGSSDRGVVTVVADDRTVAVNGVPIEGISWLRFLARPG